MRQDRTIGAVNFKTVRTAGVVEDDRDEDVIDLRALLSTLWRGRWIIAVSTLIAAVMGFLLSSQYEPRYTARTKVMFDISETNVVDVGQAVVRIDETLENQVEVLQSTVLIERVVEKLDLQNHPEFNPSLREVEQTTLDRLRDAISVPSGLGELLRNVGILPPPPPPPDAAETEAWLRLSVINRVRQSLSLYPIPYTNVIEIAVTAGDRRLAARVANTVASEYIVDQLDAKLEATREATAWLSDRVEELRLRVETAEQDVEAARAELSREMGQGFEITQAQLEALNATLSAAQAAETNARSVYGRLAEAIQTDADLGSVNEFRASALIERYRQEEVELLSQQAAIAAQVPEGHPARVRVDGQLAEVRTALRQEAERIVAAARLDAEGAEARVATLEAELRNLESRALLQSQEAVRIRQLEREAEASRVVYENFLGRLKETSEQEALQTADARVLSPAEIPLSANTDRSSRTQLLSVLLGLTAGVGIVFLLDKLNNTFRSPAQLEQMTGEYVLGVLPVLGRRLHRKEVIGYFRDNPKSALAEAVRSLRTSILFSDVDNPPKTIMFTSSVPKEGKSTTSMLVALTSRQMGKSAIIVDCDLRLPSIAQLYSDDIGEHGLLSAIEGSVPIEEAIYRDPTTGLDVLMTTPGEPRSSVNAADILSSKRFEDIIEFLKSRYDLVILDTPPTLVVADARILASHVDAVVYVVHWDRTPRAAVQEGLRDLRSVKAPIIGVAFTMLNERRAARHSYDGYSYFKGRYRDYYAS